MTSNKRKNYLKLLSLQHSSLFELRTQKDHVEEKLFAIYVYVAQTAGGGEFFCPFLCGLSILYYIYFHC